MSNLQRRKGANGEREVAALIRDWMGLNITRNWQLQAACGGADLDGVPGWAIEIKRAAEFRGDWWTQTTEQAERAGRRPVLIFLLDNTRRGQPPVDRWRAWVPLEAFSKVTVDKSAVAEISLRSWMQIARELLD